MNHPVLPDYENCVANLPNSILKYFGAEPAGSSSKLLDKYLKEDYKNVVLLVLDGLGCSILGWNAERMGFMRTHSVGNVNSVFPSATVAATTSLMTGLQPCEHGWLGWDVYYKDIGEVVTVYKNTLVGQKKQAADYFVAGKITPYKSIFDRLTEAGVKNYYISPHADIKVETFQEIIDKTKELCDQPDRKFIYAYWTSPDDIIHKYGGANEGHPKIREFIDDIQVKIEELARNMNDTLLVVTADHGHVDTTVSQLEEYPELMDCMERLPAIEPRVATFFIKKGRKREFKKLFNDIYKGKFDLLTKEEVLEKKLFGTGTEHPKFRDMLGDYVAVAIDDVTLIHTKKVKWLAAHGGVTEREMYVPVLIFKKYYLLGTDVEAYIDEALKRLKKKYPWAKKSLFQKNYRYTIEDVDGKKKFIKYYDWEDGTSHRYDDNWDGELFIQEIMEDQESYITYANEVKDVFDVRPHTGVQMHGWYLERFEFRSHVLGGYSAFVQAGDRCTGGSREFFFTPEQMSGTFEEFLESNGELLSGHFGLTSDYMEKFEGLKEFLGFKE